MEQSKKEGIAALLKRSKSYQQNYNPFVNVSNDINTLDIEPIVDANTQRGLEAATFGSVIGQAPATGSFFGDIFSTLAQTAPASLATFKERQSIKEKEAEYKTKIKKESSLAEKMGKSDFLREVKVDGNELPFDSQIERLVSREEQMARPGDFKKIYDSEKNEKLYIGPDNLPVYLPAQEARALNEEAGKIIYKVKEDPIQVYDPTAKLLDSIITMSPTEFRKRLVNNPKLTTTIPPRVLLDIEAYEKQYPIQKQNQREAKKRLSATQGLIQVQARIRESVKQGAEGGTSGAFYLGLNEAASFIKNSIRSVVGQSKASKAEVAADLVKIENELLNRETGLLREQKFTVDQFGSEAKELEAKRKKLLEAYDKDPTLSQSVENQVLKSNFIQFAYMLAKSRESGGKFSVPDIQFAFMSAGDSSNPDRIIAGINQLVTDRVVNFVDELRDTFRDLESPDETPATVIELYKRLPTYQSVFIQYQKIIGDPISEMSEERKKPWIEFNDAQNIFPSDSTIQKEKKDSIKNDINHFDNNNNTETNTNTNKK